MPVSNAVNGRDKFFKVSNHQIVRNFIYLKILDMLKINTKNLNFLFEILLQDCFISRVEESRMAEVGAWLKITNKRRLRKCVRVDEWLRKLI